MANFNSYLIQFSLVLLSQVSGAQNYDTNSLTNPYFGSLPQGEFDQIWSQVQQTLNQYDKGQSNGYKPSQKPSCPSQNQQQKPVEKPSEKPQQNGNNDQIVDILYPNKPSNTEKPQQQKPVEKPSQNGNNGQIVEILYPNKPTKPEQPQQEQKPQQPKPDQPQQQKPTEKPSQNGNNGQIVDILYPNKPIKPEQPQQEQKPQQPKPDQPQKPQQPKPENPQQSQQPNMQCAARVSENDPCSKSTAKDQGKFGTQMNQPYPSGQCTEWADARYKELFGVNGQLNGDARLWVSDARRKGNYQISAQPSVGAMVITQPGVLGAGSTGHVGVVEKVYKNGDVCVSNWNYPTPWKTTYIKQKGQAPGVDYIHKNGVQLKC
jgi:surface antigen